MKRRLGNESAAAVEWLARNAELRGCRTPRLPNSETAERRKGETAERRDCRTPKLPTPRLTQSQIWEIFGDRLPQTGRQPWVAASGFSEFGSLGIWQARRLAV